MTEPKIRRALLADAATIAGLQVRGGQWGYRGLLPDTFLLRAGRIEEREASWRQQLDPQNPRHTWIAEVDAQPLGFVTCGPTDDTELPDETGEVYSIYQEEHAAGTGIGRTLLSHATSELSARGFKRAVLWVLETNRRARRFYEMAGWTPDGATKEVSRPDHVRREVRYARELR